MNETKALCVNHHGTQSFCNQKACLQAAFKENDNAGFDVCFDIIIAVNLIKRCCKPLSLGMESVKIILCPNKNGEARDFF